MTPDGAASVEQLQAEIRRLQEHYGADQAAFSRAAQELRALDDVIQAVSSGRDLPDVLTAILGHAVPLSGATGGAVYEYDEVDGLLHLCATHALAPDLAVALQEAPLTPGDGVVGRVAASHAAVQIDDILGPGADRHQPAEILAQAGYRALVALPLLRDERLFGVLLVACTSACVFPDAVVALLLTFAAQAALAMHNDWLYQQFEEQTRALDDMSRYRSQFLASMSHELRTPLTAIISYADALQQRASALGQGAFLPDLERVSAAARHLLGLVDDLLDLSRIEAGRLDLYLEWFEIGQVVREVAAIVQPLIDTNGNTLVVACANDIGVMHADLAKLRQTLFSLLANAARFTDDGTITLRVDRSEEGSRSDGQITFEVTDTGVGMTADQLAHVFQAFSPSELSRSRSAGTGLGLAISRHYCRMMGGDLTATSSHGHGSTFTARLPDSVPEPAS